jgi:hypothetical protein
LEHQIREQNLQSLNLLGSFRPGIWGLQVRDYLYVGTLWLRESNMKVVCKWEWDEAIVNER